MTTLVLAAHPDDETIGAGGTIARLAAAGHKVVLWVATEVYEPLWPATQKPPRRAEAEKAAGILGIAETRFASLPTMNLSTMASIDLAGAVERMVDEVRPEVLFCTPPDDINSDHSALFDAALVATRGVPGNPIRAFYAYEIGTTSHFHGPRRTFHPTTFVDITETFQKKLDAFRAYESEKRRFPHPRSPEGLEAIARERGLGCGCAYAECFMLVSRRYGRDEALTL